MVLETLKCNLQYVIPHHLLSRIIAKLADCKVPVVKNWLIKAFIHSYKIDMSIAATSDLSQYQSFNDFFTRALAPQFRPIVAEQNTLASPADGTISQLGSIKEGKLFQAKGHSFNLTELVGGEKKIAEAYENGSFITIYLAPHNYHRVHMPLDGKLLKTIYVPGKLFSVNNRSVESIPNLFCRNERLICLFETVVGKMALIMVGAMLVAGIETVWGQREVPCKSREMITKDYEDKNIVLAKGAEMGRFQFGSTVILLFPSHKVQLIPLSEPQPINMGELIGHVMTQGSN